MPYISQDSRAEYNDEINSLVEKLEAWDNDTLSGHLNYIFFRIVALLGKNESYARMATVSSALSEAQAEFRRRIMAPYEDEKIQQNGDIQL
jgi:hypothetical protein